MKRPIPQVDLLSPENRSHISSGCVVSTPLKEKDAVSLELHYCTAFLGPTETYQVICSLAKAGHQQWGQEFIGKVLQVLETL